LDDVEPKIIKGLWIDRWIISGLGYDTWHQERIRDFVIFNRLLIA